ncbi:adenylyltransferase/cytidyltransferase family protein [Klebsiella sp. BIGb0407]|uniref:adenylyltransferase/cytidyltransferase family protein n=1 Tax=Klebsiella sp. BIGb0407 TaxID=2940603 RepID=UPI00216996F2|nr:adenylyltransferase/cytidyltransferase family protein [Klebsiella sp. BIGb0407]MCS3429812.1 rfaE bifunctional protein nucleotidyltransferase chain/domain [Klebsiella sp. BIGb0407]
MGVLKDIIALQDEAVYCREKGLTIGLCHGCFDIVHPGHIYHLQRARTMVDRLFVSVTADEYVNKGVDRPVFPERKRAEFLASIRYCDHVIVNHTATAELIIKKLRPNLYFKGADYIDGSDIRLQVERALVESEGGRMILTDNKIFDSTSRIAKLVMSTSK